MDDKGLAMKRPAERKRFVNSIISSLEVYNNMYKTLNKHSSVYKSMVNSVASKLGQLGDENILKSNFSALSSRSTQLSAQKDQYMQKMGEFKLLPPNRLYQELMYHLTSKIEWEINIESIFIEKQIMWIEKKKRM